jgi:hypothetical protein
VSTRSKVSLELVGEFFEVRTQVDRDLTTVSRVDRRLGLIKILGHHSAWGTTGPSGVALGRGEGAGVVARVVGKGKN